MSEAVPDDFLDATGRCARNAYELSDSIQELLNSHYHPDIHKAMLSATETTHHLRIAATEVNP